MTGRVDSSMVTSANELPGYRVVRNFGIVAGDYRAFAERAGNLAAGIQTIIGGNIFDTDRALRKGKRRGLRDTAAGTRRSMGPTRSCA